MSNGGPHGDKWSKFSFSPTMDRAAISSDDTLGILNLTPDGYSAVGGPLLLACSDGTFLFIGYYGGQGQQ